MQEVNFFKETAYHEVRAFPSFLVDLEGLLDLSHQHRLLPDRPVDL